MSVLVALQEQLQDTGAAISRAERAYAETNDPTLPYSIRSLEKRRKILEDELHSAAASIGREVCTYRLIPEWSSPSITGIANTLGEYQHVISSFYSALTTGPKAKATISHDAARHTALDFGYALAGSVQFVLTVPADRNLLGESSIDETLDAIESVSKTTSSDAVLTHARKLGPGPIRVFYKWVESHVKAGFHADIVWRDGDTVKHKMSVQLPEFMKLREAISATSDESIEEYTVSGELQGADAVTRQFHFFPDMGGDVRGVAAKGVIDEKHKATIPKRYRVTIRQTKRTIFFTDEEKTWHELLKMEPI